MTQPVAGWGSFNIMPSEVRIIAFTSEDVLEAVDEFGAIVDKRLSGGKVTDCHVGKHPGVHALLEVQRAAGEKTGTVDLNSTQLAAALISFCFDHYIPLPRSASKELDVIDDQLVLRLELGAKNIQRASKAFDWDNWTPI